MPGLLETIVALCALSLLAVAATDDDAGTLESVLVLDDAVLASVGWL